MTINWHGARSPRLKVILDDPEDFGLRGKYLAYYYSSRGNGEDSFDRESTHKIVREVKSDGKWGEEPMGRRNWPHWNRYAEKPDPSSFSDHREYIDYVFSHPDYISVEHFDVDPADTNYIDGEQIIEWLQYQSKLDGYRIVNIKPSDFDISYDDYSNMGTYTSSIGDGEYTEEGLEWTIDFDSSGWTQVKL